MKLIIFNTKIYERINIIEKITYRYYEKITYTY
jgi:hypothetical protein